MEQTTVYDVSLAPRPRRKVTKGFSSTPDEALLAASRRGDHEAYGELYRRHSKAALVAARSFRDLAEPDDVVSEAFANIYEALAGGAGPTGAFRPYLYVTIRNLAHRRLRTTGHETDLEVDSATLPAADHPVQAALDSSLTTTAFRSLPERWQTVLWYTEVERMSPKQAGELMGIGANAVSALSFRARAALREAWVQGHVTDSTATGTHREVLSRLAGWSLGTLSQRDEAMANEHLKTCTRCRLVAEELEDVSSRLAIILLPLILGGTAALLFQRQIVAGAGSATAASAGYRLSAVTRPTRAGWLSVGGAVVAIAAAVVVANAVSKAPSVDTAGTPQHSTTATAPAAPSLPSPSVSPPAAIAVPPPADTTRPHDAGPNDPGPNDPGQRSMVPPPAVVIPPAGQSPATGAISVGPGSGAPPTQPTSPATPPSTPPPLSPEAAPVLTSPASVLTKDATTTITGTAPAGSTVMVRRTVAAAPLSNDRAARAARTPVTGATAVGTAPVDGSGSWTWTATDLAQGTTRFLFTATHPGNAPSSAVSVTVTRDSIAPAAPVITSVASNTQIAPYQLSGTAEPSSVVTVESSSGAVLTTVTADASGRWSTAVIPGFTPVMSSLLVTATDAAGNVSEAATAGPFAFQPVFQDPDGQRFDTPTVAVNISGWPGSSVTLTLNGVAQGGAIAFPPTGELHLTARTTDGSPLTPGDYSVTATYVDGANSSSATATWTFTVAPR